MTSLTRGHAYLNDCLAEGIKGQHNIGAGDAATADTNDLAEVFTITPTKGMDKMIIEIAVANTNGTVACSLGAGGTYWASLAKTWNAVQNKTSIFHVSDIARFAKYVGTTTKDTILLTLTPASGKKLLTDHTAVVKVIELP